MSRLTLRPNPGRDLAPLARMLGNDADDLALSHPHAKAPFDEGEWQRKWLNEPDDASFDLIDAEGRDVGFVTLHVGVGPEVRHLTYVFVEKAARGGTGGELTALAEAAARYLGALTMTLKVETDNAPAVALYRAAGYEELSRRGAMATLRRDLD